MSVRKFLLSFALCVPQLCEASSVREVMNVPKVMEHDKGGQSVNIAVVEHNFNLELFDPNYVTNCIDPNVDQQRVQENVSLLVSGALNNLQKTPDSVHGDKQASAICQPFPDLPDVVIFLGVAYTHKTQIFECMACETLESEFMKNPFIMRKGNFQTNDPYGNTTQEVLQNFLKEVFEFSENRRKTQRISHGNQVISCLQSIAPYSSIHVYAPCQLHEIAENNEISVVTMSAFDFDIMDTKKTIEKFSPFAKTGKIITLALDNKNQDSAQILVYSDLCQYANNNGFYVVLCGSSSLKSYELEENKYYYLGNLSYVSKEFKGVLSGHYVTAPGYQIPYQDGTISGNSFAAPHTAGVIVRYLSEYPETHLGILFNNLVGSGRKRSEELEVSNELEERFLIALEHKYPEQYKELCVAGDYDTTLANARNFFKNILIGPKDREDLLIRGFKANLNSSEEEQQFRDLNVYGDLSIFNKYWNFVDYGRLVEKFNGQLS